MVMKASARALLFESHRLQSVCLLSVLVKELGARSPPRQARVHDLGKLTNSPRLNLLSEHRTTMKSTSWIGTWWVRQTQLLLKQSILSARGCVESDNSPSASVEQMTTCSIGEPL
ncbi:hypothetical protein AUEXF2481DRAFT_582624 [Aureobasidium subglaciale EXF-2481]|uniref:Uncharacterized protein n=1 Tax=Aureobasidium subglaciale (strain EXF-2481) TaxID=1043005 RepID=A0A074ZEX1_AURSE|nr:uncharacterized protein AUEXF2481DRAFT_582624 [Aureobasidium subglaciale EXF-2481]KEQ97176.1 hypothetical protein AUEXF2481DRAFT_582624 [Aureobasidium subglaciale EXF-2481]